MPSGESLKDHFSAKRAKCSAQAADLSGVETHPLQRRYRVKNNEKVRRCGRKVVDECLHEVEERTESGCIWLDVR